MIGATRPAGPARALTVLVGLTLAAPGCHSMNNTDRGVATGGILGAVAGTAVGAATGRPLAGAAVGAGLGAVAGGATGAAIDRSERRAEARVAAQRAISLNDVVQLTASGSSDEVIIAQIRNSGCAYNLSAQEVIWLQDNGVREPVIRELQASAFRPARHVYTPVAVAPVAPVYIVEPPPPPIGVGVGLHFGGRRCR